MGEKFTPISFGDLLTATGEEVGIDTEDELIKIASRFYTDLTLDGRFVIKENNTWTLREHELFANVHIDMNEVYQDDEDSEKEEGEENSEEGSDSSSEGNDEKEEELGEETDDYNGSEFNESDDDNN